MLVVAYALAGRMDIDLTTEPLALDPNGEPVFLQDLWPTPQEMADLAAQCVKQEFFETEYGKIFDGDDFWHTLGAAQGATFAWEAASTYIKQPPYFTHLTPEPAQPADIVKARVLALLGDSITTDHISPAGGIRANYPAGQYLQAHGVAPADFNSYGSRRGNHEIMMRGTFGNVRLKNLLVAPKEGSFTRKFPDGGEMFIYDAAMAYQAEGTPLIVIGGKEYGSGSSRDWAAKGVNLLGVKAVIAESYERIHRSNLVGMGVLPCVFKAGENPQTLGLDGAETYTISGIADIAPRKTLAVTATKTDGATVNFEVIARLDTEVDVEYFRHGGILPYVLRKLMA